MCAEVVPEGVGFVQIQIRVVVIVTWSHSPAMLHASREVVVAWAALAPASSTTTASDTRSNAFISRSSGTRGCLNAAAEYGIVELLSKSIARSRRGRITRHCTRARRGRRHAGLFSALSQSPGASLVCESSGRDRGPALTVGRLLNAATEFAPAMNDEDCRRARESLRRDVVKRERSGYRATATDGDPLQ